MMTETAGSKKYGTKTEQKRKGTIAD